MEEEIIESVPEKVIESVKSVGLNDVDDYLTQGYSVYHIYSKTAVLVKYKPVNEKSENEIHA